MELTTTLKIAEVETAITEYVAARLHQDPKHVDVVWEKGEDGEPIAKVFIETTERNEDDLLSDDLMRQVIDDVIEKWQATGKPMPTAEDVEAMVNARVDESEQLPV